MHKQRSIQVADVPPPDVIINPQEFNRLYNEWQIRRGFITKPPVVRGNAARCAANAKRRKGKKP
jgi:hypothetical protein